MPHPVFKCTHEEPAGCGPPASDLPFVSVKFGDFLFADLQKDTGGRASDELSDCDKPQWISGYSGYFADNYPADHEKFYSVFTGGGGLHHYSEYCDVEAGGQAVSVPERNM